jgi:PAS domain S-box-containing protein
MGCCLIDPHGEIVFDADWYCRYGIQGATCSVHSFRNCLAADPFLEPQPCSGKIATLHTCDNGFSALGAPIMIDNIHVGSMFIGLFSRFSERVGQLSEIEGSRNKDAMGDINGPVTPPVMTDDALAGLTERLEIMVELLAEMGRLALQERQTARKLHNIEQRHQHLLDSFPLVVYESDHEGRIVFANDTALEHFNCSAADIDQGLSLFSFVPPDEVPKLVERQQRLLRGEQLEPTEYTLTRKNGVSDSALIYSQPILVDGEVTGICSIYIDISERKAMEERSGQ